MTDRTPEFGTLGARAIKGYEAAPRRLDQLANCIATPVILRRAPPARLHYLTCTDHAKAAARAAGLKVTDRTLKRWAEGKATSSKTSLAQVFPAASA
ncbi:hypothetical protein [Streptomyces sp. NPDC056949]|uniref:hypothetical protein n=1 Tax=Streptomyces sp. NPDC056949 TaxID=3345976 RepID=UPI003642E919